MQLALSLVQLATVNGRTLSVFVVRFDVLEIYQLGRRYKSYRAIP